MKKGSYNDRVVYKRDDVVISLERNRPIDLEVFEEIALLQVGIGIWQWDYELGQIFHS